MALCKTLDTSVAICLLMFASIIYDKVHALRIKALKIPGLVQNGTEESAILDCIYEFENRSSSKSEGGRASELGLTVKWYFGSDPTFVYQWIAKYPPQDAGRLRGRLDLSYRATDDEYTMHRAISIRKPTVELTGEYRCTVSTFDQEASVSDKLVVFVPEKSMTVSQSKTREDLVHVSCRVEGVYPEPNITLFLLRNHPEAWLNDLTDDHGSQEESESREEENDIDISALLPLEGVTVQTIAKESGVFDVEAWVEVQDSFLIEGTDKNNPAPVSFHCLLGIPNSEYSRRESIVYYPGPPTTSTITTEGRPDDETGSSAVSLSPTCLYYFLLLVYVVSEQLALRS